jgi:16S rRNA processing protein RimM
MQEYLQVGTIISSHALKGEVKVYPLTDDPHRFDDLSHVLIDPEGARRELQLEKVRYFKNLVIAKFQGIDRIEDTEDLMKKDLYIPREEAIPLEEGEYYIADLFDLSVVEEESGREIGSLYDVLKTGANDVYIVRSPEKKGKELLLPVIEEVIRDIDLEKGTITVHLMDGLEWS